jgi:hypothetical protein
MSGWRDMAAASRLFGIGAPAGIAVLNAGFRAPAALQPPTVRSFAASAWLTRIFSGASATPAVRPMNRCAQCKGQFGLVRHRHFGRQFCSDANRNRCKQHYLADHAGELSVRLKNTGPIIAKLFRKIGGIGRAFNFAGMVVDQAGEGPVFDGASHPH